MKSVTEFANFTLTQGLQAKAAFAAEGKSPEEVNEALAAKFKLEGDKLKHFLNALDVATTHATNLRRVMVVSLAEGETVPAKAAKVEEHHYVPEFHVEAQRPGAQKTDAKGGRGGKGKGGGRGGDRGKGGGGEKESPWGLSPEQKAAKKAAGMKSANKPAPAK
jgi:uncharacterized membrane protein YgcG